MVTFPHMGNLHIPLQALFQELGVDSLVPPPTSPKTLQYGRLYSPEFACLPLKIHLGNFIEALDRGAHTLIMIGGGGPCRLGLFALLEEMILEDLGYDFSMIVLEPSLKEIYSSLRKISPALSFPRLVQALYWSYQKLLAVELVEERVNERRPYVKGMDSLKEKYLQAINDAKTLASLKEIVQEVAKLQKSTEGIRVGIIGDIFTILDSFANLDLLKELGELGVIPCPTIQVSSWIKEHLFLRPLGLLFRDPLKKATRPYLGYEVGGLGLEGIGHSVLSRERGLAGIIQVFPLTCMPEIVSGGILPQVSRDCNIPIMRMIFDEDTSRVGFQTRLEAFVHLLKRRRGDDVGERVLSRCRSRRDKDPYRPL